MKILRQIATIFLIVNLLGCSNHEENSIGESKLFYSEPETTVNFLGHWYGEGKREELVLNIARDYEFENQHIRINMKFPEEVYYQREDFLSNQKFVAKIILEEEPQWDIIRINGQYNEVVAINGDTDWPGKHLVDFSQIEEFRKGVLPELLTEKSKASWNGIIPGPFIEGQYWSLWVNKKVAAKVGISVKQFGMTFDDFLGYLKAVDHYNSTHSEGQITPIFNCTDWSTVLAIGIQLFASTFDNPSDFFDLKISAKSIDAWEKTLEAAGQMSQYHPLHKNWKEMNWNNTSGLLLEGDFLFQINGSWMYNIWQNIDEAKVIDCMPAELPVFKPTPIYPTNYNVSWGVLKNAPHKEEAIKFLLAMNTPTTSELWVRYTKCPTGIKGNLTGLSLGSDQFENFSTHIQETYKEYPYKMLENSSWLIFGAKYNSSPNFFVEVIEGKLTAKEAMRTIRTNLLP